MADPAPGLVWGLVVVLGVGTFALRVSFIQVHAWVGEFPAWLERTLIYIPPAVLAALVFPALFSIEGSLATGLVNERALAGGVAAAVAWRTGSMIATIAVGMGVVWLAGLVVA